MLSLPLSIGYVATVHSIRTNSVDVTLPIATISFGVDFRIDAVGRCREELATGKSHRLAYYVVGIATVGGALALALSTSSIDFGSNAASGIPGVIQFGLGA